MTGSRAAAGPAPAALLQEALRRGPVVWVAAPGGREQLLWCLWSDGAVWVVTGGAEQPWPAGTAARVVLTVRSKERPAVRLAQVPASVHEVAPGSPEWERGAPMLAGARLNAPDARSLPARWARDSRVLRLQPDP